MRLFVSVLATFAILFSASSAFAQANWSVNASTDGAGGLGALQVGDSIVLDITLGTSDQALAIAGSVNDYDNSIVGFDAGNTIVTSSALNAICTATVGCLGGLSNLSTPVEEQQVGIDQFEVEFFSAISLSPAGGNGSVDWGYDGVTGSPQFRVAFQALSPGITTLQIGTFAEYLDGYTGSSSSQANNTSVTVTVVPEPGTALLMGLGLAGLAAVRRNA